MKKQSGQRVSKKRIQSSAEGGEEAGSRNINEKSVSIVLTLATVALALAAVVQVGFLYTQIKVMETDQRAWMELRILKDPRNSRYEIVAQNGAPIVASLILRNVGKTAARTVHALVFLSLVDSQTAPPPSVGRRAIVARSERKYVGSSLSKDDCRQFRDGSSSNLEYTNISPYYDERVQRNYGRTGLHCGLRKNSL
jgi:hypothetical protein